MEKEFAEPEDDISDSYLSKRQFIQGLNSPAMNALKRHAAVLKIAGSEKQGERLLLDVDSVRDSRRSISMPDFATDIMLSNLELIGLLFVAVP